jgi:hypothetical protein
LLTCYLAQRGAVKFVKDFFAVKDITNAWQRLDRLILEPVVANTTLILGHVDGLERRLVDGEPTHSAFNPPSLEIFFSLDGKASTQSVQKVPGTFCGDGELVPSLTER